MKSISTTKEQKIIKDELIFHYVKSTGPGGQNINKRNTKVQVFFDFQNSKYLSDNQKTELQKTYKESNIVISSHDERSQKQNKESAIKKLFETINKKLFCQKKRIATKTPKSQKEKRYVDKTRQGRKKKIRSKKITLDKEE